MHSKSGKHHTVTCGNSLTSLMINYIVYMILAFDMFITIIIMFFFIKQISKIPGAIQLSYSIEIGLSSFVQ